MTEFQTGPELENEAIVAQVREEMAKIFSDYKTLDRTRWDGYKPEEDDADNGRLLTFYLGETEPSNPNIMFIFKKAGGFAVNFYNNPLGFGSETHISVKGGSVYADYNPKVAGYWCQDQLEYSVESVKIWMDGIPLIPEVVDLPTFIVGSENKFLTLKEVIKEAESYANAKPKEKKLLNKEELFLPKNILGLGIDDPELITDFLRKRFAAMAKYGTKVSIQGREYTGQELLDEEKEGTEFGVMKAMRLEMIRLEIWRQMLEQKGILRSGRSQPLKLPS